MSVVHVTETTLYYRGLPASGGLLDPLMGSVDRRHLCASCCRDARSCQGHAGHIELAYPVYHIGFLDNVLKTLRCTCFFCARVCTDDEDLCKDTQGRTRLNAMHAALRTRKTCPHCGATRPTYTRTPLGISTGPPIWWESEEERVFATALYGARGALHPAPHRRAVSSASKSRTHAT